MKNLGIVFAALGGLVAGAAIGMLFAPASGEDTRTNIKNFLKSHCPALKGRKLEELADRISEEIHEA